jgi:hypothetical protein
MEGEGVLKFLAPVFVTTILYRGNKKIRIGNIITGMWYQLRYTLYIAAYGT